MPPAPLPKERGGERCRTGLSDSDPTRRSSDARRVIEDLAILEAQDGEPGGGEPVVTLNGREAAEASRPARHPLQ